MSYFLEQRLFLYSFFQDLGMETVYAPASHLNYKELSTFSSNEWCYSLKLMFYDLLKALDMGADTLVNCSYGFFRTLGPCRLPHVFEHSYKDILEKMSGKKFDYFVFYFNITTFELSLLDMLRKMGYLHNPLNILRYRAMLKKAKSKLKMFDEVKGLMRKTRAREKKRGESFRIYKEFLHDLEREQDGKRLEELFSGARKRLMAVEKDETRKSKKIAIIGDYLSIVSEFPCFDLENFIANKFSIEVYQPHSLYKYYFDTKFLWSDKAIRLERKYKKFWVGGSDVITFKAMVKALDEKVDGIIHLRNFGCAPEDMIVEAVDRLKRDIDGFPPFISITFDEHTNAEGVKTRIEAFCNTLLRVIQ